MTSLSLRGRVVQPDRVHPDAVVDVVDGIIAAVREPRAGDPAPSTDTLLPGLVDIHCHGGGGGSFTSGDPASIRVGATHHRAHGTTSLVGSAVTDTPARLLEVVSALADAADDGLLAGIHVEGPFLSAGACGAQDPALLLTPDVALAREIVAAGRGWVRVMTVAAELPGADEVADALAELGVVAALGHTTADAARARDFLARPGARGNSLVTHLFNGMPPVHHRSPGPALASLAAAAQGGAVVELIADGVHVDDETARAVLAVAPGHVALITDAMSAAGMPDGDYQLGPQSVEVRDSVARLAGGGSIAGGTARLVDVLRRVVRAGVPLSTAVAAASLVPARALGLADTGALLPGLRADLLVVDDDWQPRRVHVRGVPVASDEGAAQ